MPEQCEIAATNATPDEIVAILRTARRIAVVGHSNDPSKDSYRIGRYLATAGYEVIPVNPNGRSTAELRFVPDLASVPGPIDIVDIFRRPEAVPPIVDEAIRIGAKAIWMQLGIVHNAAAAKARAAGLKVVMNHCIMVEHRKLPR
ncbi:MAG TPA: CoA-binding protein [Candidatus Polarisedimenticolia bacterium]